MEALKPVVFLGSSLEDLRAFPSLTRREAGYQIDRVQHGLMPGSWKPLPSIGPSVQEIRVRDAFGAFRVIYIAKFPDAVYILHCFQKKSQKTSQKDLDLAAKRYRDLLQEMTNYG